MLLRSLGTVEGSLKFQTNNRQETLMKTKKAPKITTISLKLDLDALRALRFAAHLRIESCKEHLAEAVACDGCIPETVAYWEKQIAALEPTHDTLATAFTAAMIKYVANGGDWNY